MDKLDKVELIREKTGASYEDAKGALDACGDDVLDALVWLEREGKVSKGSAHHATGRVEAEPSPEMLMARTHYDRTSEKTAFGKAWDRVVEALGQLWHASKQVSFVAERYGERVVCVPVVVPILGLLLWGATLWVLIIGLFFGFRYRIEGIGSTKVDVNGAMDWAADKAEELKDEFTRDGSVRF